MKTVVEMGEVDGVCYWLAVWDLYSGRQVGYPPTNSEHSTDGREIREKHGRREHLQRANSFKVGGRWLVNTVGDGLSFDRVA